MGWTSLFADITSHSASIRPHRQSKDKLRSDMKLLASFVGMYCRGKHGNSPKAAVTFKGNDLQRACGQAPLLCADCAKLLQHALVKRAVCPMNPKPPCRRCGRHCYAPRYREMIRTVMAYSGRRAVLRGRLDYLRYLLP